MALVVADRVQETTTTSGTGTLSLAGAVNGYQTFVSGIGSGNTTYYTIYDTTAQVWEVGIGTVTAGIPNTLSRTTVLSNSSGTTSPLNLAGNTAVVFCTYPSEKSVNLDTSGNVTPLGTISSAVWNASTIPVAYGGTGVTTSSGANSVVLRDSNVNISANNFIPSFTKTIASGGTTVLTAASTFYQNLAAGTGGQTFQLPDATTLTAGATYIFDNDSTGTLTIQDHAGGAIDTINPGGLDYIFLESNSTVAGTWGQYAFIPDTYDFTTSTASFGNATITNATWNGNAIPYNYGGTTLTTFLAANNAIYSTSASALTAGTLPVAAGGTGATTLTGYVYGNGTGAMTASTTIPSSAISGTIATTNALTINNSGTGATSGTTFNGSSAVTISYNTVGASPLAGSTSLTTLGTVTTGTWNANTVAISYGGTGITSFGTGVQTALGQNVTGSGGFVLATSPTLVTPNLGTPSAAVLTNATGLPLSTGVTGTLGVSNGGTGLTSLTSGYIPYGSGTSAFSSSSGFTFSGTTLSAPFHVATGTISSSLSAGAYSYGTLGYSDVNIFSSFTTSVNTYAQMILQNTNSGAAASADFIVSNNLGTASNYYGDFGINSSTFSGTGSFALANAVYMYSIGGDLVLGTQSTNAIHFVINNGGTDALTIGTSGAITTGTWNGSTITTGYGGTGLTSFTSGGAVYALSSSSLTTGTLPVASGGTGATTLTGYVYGNGTGAMTASTTIPGSAISSAVSSATNIASGAANQIPYQTAASTTSFITAPTTASTYLQWTGSAFTWAAASATSNYTRTAFTATSGQTTFTVTYVVGLIQVYVNGVLLNASDYTATSGTSVVLAVGANTGDIVEFIAWSVTSMASTASAVTFNNSGTGATSGTTFNGSSPVTVSYNTLGASPLAGSTSLTTVGTITTGTWNANTVAVSYGGTGATTLTGYVYGNGTGAMTASTTIPGSAVSGNISGSAGSVANALTVGTGLSLSSGTTYNGSAALTISNSGVTSASAGTGISVSGSTGSVTFTNSGIISASAGTGISVSGTNPLTITNTGVTSISAGTGISVSGSTGGVTVTNSGVTSVNGSTGAVTGLASLQAGVVLENGQTISSNYTMTTGNNGMCAGPITIATGVTVTIPTGSNWSIV